MNLVSRKLSLKHVEVDEMLQSVILGSTKVDTYKLPKTTTVTSLL